MHNNPHIKSEAVITALLWCCVFLTGYYFFNRIIVQEKFGFHDWYLFIGHAKSFISTGLLYDRDLSHYEPSAAIYKFPPLFASLLIWLFNCGLNEEMITQIFLFAYLGCYFLSIAMCLMITHHANRKALVPYALILAFTFEPFFDNYISAQMEVYILLLLSCSLLSLLQGRDLLSGFFIGAATAIKIYPVYFAGYYFAHKKYSAIAGIFLGLSAASIFSLAVAGWAEHLFYVDQILPTLLTEHISNKGENISIAHLFLFFNLPMKAAQYLSLIILLMPIACVGVLSILDRRAIKPENTGIHFAIVIGTFLLATKNSWWNYQILLIIPLIVIFGLRIENKPAAWFSIIMCSLACLMIFWCNLGKLETLILFFTNVLDASPFLTVVMLKINLLRGLATFLVLLTLVFLLFQQKPKNISLVENRFNT